MFFRPKLGLTLGGGGARGGAHIGVLRVLEEIGYRPDVVVGTSIGGVIAAMIGAGWRADQIENVVQETDFNALLNIDRSCAGLIGNGALETELRRHFGDSDLRDLPIRTAVMAVDVHRVERVLIDRGPIVQAVLATASVPGLLPPIQWGDHLLVDGGIISNVPTEATYRLGAQRVVAVDLAGESGLGLALSDVGSFSKRLQRLLYWLLNLSRRQEAFDIFIQSAIVSYQTLVSYELANYPPDVLIRPDLPPLGLLAMERSLSAVESGEEAARKAAPRIRALIRPPYFRPARPGYPLPPLVIADDLPATPTASAPQDHARRVDLAHDA